MSVDARSAVLARIGTALGRNETDKSLRDAAWHALPRAYRQALVYGAEERVALLAERLRDYDAEVTRVSETGVAEAMARILHARGDRPTLLANGFPAAWAPTASTLVAEPEEPLTARELDQFDGVVTGATLAIAETGTLVLQAVPGQGRRASTLVPDFHLCVVREEDIVSGVPEAFARLEATCTLPTTFVSGPSATADIEMTRIKGVHGPRFLHVLLVQAS